jgi:hypothetical protein
MPDRAAPGGGGDRVQPYGPAVEVEARAGSAENGPTP